MRNNVHRYAVIVRALGIVTVFLAMFIMYQISFNIRAVLDMSVAGALMAAGYCVMLIFHLFSFVYVLMLARKKTERRSIPVFVLIFGVASLFSIGGQKVMYDELGRELPAGFDVGGSLLMLGVLIVINALYAATVCFMTFTDLRDKGHVMPPVRDENIFVIAQYLGVVSGLSGLFLTFFIMAGLSMGQWTLDRLWVFIPFYAMILAPYVVTVFYWLMLKRNLCVDDWYDEKQLRDIMKSSLTTLVISVPGMCGVALFGEMVSVLWLPYWFFFSLGAFSAGTWYYFMES